jgi:hypothetical protein
MRTEDVAPTTTVQGPKRETPDMPYVIRRPKRLAGRASALVAVVVAILVVPAVASAAACPSTPTTKAFNAFGDTANYSLVSNGAFESGTSGWTLSRASVASGNESWYVHGTSDTKSLAINPSGTAVSPAFCVSVDHPTFRFFARRTSGTWGNLAVRLRWRDASGATNETTVGTMDGGSGSWQVSPSFKLATTLPLWQSGQTLSVQIVFDPEDYGGAFAIDDVYIDPYTKG